jgi:hypothetical protein
LSFVVKAVKAVLSFVVKAAKATRYEIAKAAKGTKSILLLQQMQKLQKCLLQVKKQ